MNTVEDSFREWLDVVQEPDREYRDDVQVNVRLDEQVIVGLDALAKRLGCSRTAVARRIVSSGIHDALRAGHLRYCFEPDVGYTVVPAKADCPEGTFPLAMPYAGEAEE